MKDNSGFSNWETERMYDYATRKGLTYLPPSMESFLGKLRPYELEIQRQGFKSFITYQPDPVNYWEVYARIAFKMFEYITGRPEASLPIHIKELTS